VYFGGMSVRGMRRLLAAQVSMAWPSRADSASPDAWAMAIDDLLANLPAGLRAHAGFACVGGTSSSCLLVNGATGRPSRPARMYDWSLGGQDETDALGDALVDATWEVLDEACPQGHTARAGTSTLAKLVRGVRCVRAVCMFSPNWPPVAG
jgi:hypothetical protein